MYILVCKDGNPFENTDDWKKFNSSLLPEKEDFYSNLKMKDITDADYVHKKGSVKILKKKEKQLNGLVFVYEISGCGFKYSCSHINFRYVPG